MGLAIGKKVRAAVFNGLWFGDGPEDTSVQGNFLAKSLVNIQSSNLSAADNSNNSLEPN